MRPEGVSSSGLCGLIWTKRDEKLWGADKRTLPRRPARANIQKGHGTDHLQRSLASQEEDFVGKFLEGVFDHRVNH